MSSLNKDTLTGKSARWSYTWEKGTYRYRVQLEEMISLNHYILKDIKEIKCKNLMEIPN